jgi:hypothetical protein
VLVVVASVAVAGCGATQGPTPTPTPSGTTAAAGDATPAATAETGETTQTTPASLPPGVTADSVTDPAALVAAHVQTLSAQSFTVVTVRRTVDPDSGETRRRSETTWRIDPTGEFRGLYRWELVQSPDESSGVAARQPPSEATTYRAGETIYRRTVRQSDQSTETESQSTDGRSAETDSPSTATGGATATGGETDSGQRVTFVQPTLVNSTLRLGPALHRRPIAAVGDANATDVTVERVTHDGESRYLISAALPGDRFRSNHSIELLVTPDGLVTEIHQRYESSFTGSVVERTVRFRAVGETTVDQPDWYDEAREATNNTSTG